MADIWDVVVVGAGTAGMPAAVFAAQRGARVLVIEHASEIGGALHLSAGQMSGAGTKLQAAKGIDDTADQHYEDVMRISNNTADPALVRLAVDHGGKTIDWLLDNGLEIHPEHPVRGLTHEPYSKDRYYWGPDGGRSVLRTLSRVFVAELARGNLTLKLETEVTGLVRKKSGPVTGVTTRAKDGSETQYDGHNVVLASGGYCADADVFEELNGIPLYGNAAYPFARGSGIKIGQSVGGWTRGKENYICSFTSVLESAVIPSPVVARLILAPEFRQPWEIFVNAEGKRFIREDEPSVDTREHALLAQTNLRCWSIFDDVILKESPNYVLNTALPDAMPWPKEKVFEAFDTYEFFYKADTLHELASRTGVNAGNLKTTIADYNVTLCGSDPFGRQHRPKAIETPPFYAIRIQGVSFTSAVGLAVDDSLRVTNKNRKPIRGLYAIGELLGAGQTMGNATVGGMLVAPAISFGRLLGQTILEWPGSKNEAAE
jgi:fumarate reductase flavoprotein subunit